MDLIKIHGNARHLARIAAVQAIYQIELNPDSKRITSQFLNTYFRENCTGTTKPDADLFQSITNCLQKDLNQYDSTISEYLNKGWQLERLPTLSRAILRCALYELARELTVPTPVILNEYIEVAKDFLEEKDVSFIHGILHQIAKKIRLDS